MNEQGDAIWQELLRAAHLRREAKTLQSRARHEPNKDKAAELYAEARLKFRASAEIVEKVR